MAELKAAHTTHASHATQQATTTNILWYKNKKEGKNKQTETKTNEDKQIDYTKKGRCKKEVNTNWIMYHFFEHRVPRIFLVKMCL